MACASKPRGWLSAFQLLQDSSPCLRAVVLLLSIGILSALGSCSSRNAPATGGSPPPEVAAILQFQSSGEALVLPRLQVGSSVYSDVSLRLAKDGSWKLSSIGSVQPLSAKETVQAVLTAPSDAVIDTHWRPPNATITISRLHIDAKVFGNVALLLAGDKWSWQSELQELSALTRADFTANTSLIATEAHHVVLRSAPENDTQSYPLRLGAKVYKFCMDRQDDGADTLRLLDPLGTEVFRLKAGDPCVDIKLDAGLYTLQHSYGGSGSKRTIFVRPAAAAAPPIKRLRSRGSFAADYPEFWAVYYRDGNDAMNFLSYTGRADRGGARGDDFNYYALGCWGRIKAIAHTGYYVWPDDPTTRTRVLFSADNFFEVSGGVLGPPLHCFEWPPGTGTSVVHPGLHSYAVTSLAGDLMIAPLGYAQMPSGDSAPNPWPPAYNANLPGSENGWAASYWLTMQNFTNNSFQLTVSCNQDVRNSTFGLGYGVDYCNGFFPSPLIVKPGQNTVGLDPNAWPPAATFNLGFRYFPNGMPPSMKNSDGGWNLAKGEVAMFSATNCAGPAMISEGISLPVHPQPTWSYSQADLAVLDGLHGSLQLGPLTAVSVYTGNAYQGNRKIYNASGCLPFGDAGFGSLEISTDTATIVVQTDKCEYCNLAGVDLSGLDLSAGVKLQHANLTGTRFANSDLSNADLRFATLQGANLNNANLDSANLCLASLNADGTGAAARLAGAHLKNANLYGANLDGADFTYASLYSDAPKSCQSSACDAYTRPSCASAYQASMTGTTFANAYLAGTDMGHATASGAVFSGATLFGVSFIGASLTRNAGTGAVAKFDNAFLQGTDFTNADVRYANFNNAYVDSGSNTCMQTLLNNEFTGFPGLKVANTAGQCVAGVQLAPTCVQYVYSSARLPVTDATNACPDGSSGPCTASGWTSPRIPIGSANQKTSTCQPSPLCDGFATPLNTCW